MGSRIAGQKLEQWRICAVKHRSELGQLGIQLGITHGVDDFRCDFNVLVSFAPTAIEQLARRSDARRRRTLLATTDLLEGLYGEASAASSD